MRIPSAKGRWAGCRQEMEGGRKGAADEKRWGTLETRSTDGGRGEGEDRERQDRRISNRDRVRLAKQKNTWGMGDLNLARIRTLPSSVDPLSVCRYPKMQSPSLSRRLSQITLLVTKKNATGLPQVKSNVTENRCEYIIYSGHAVRDIYSLHEPFYSPFLSKQSKTKERA